MSRTAAEIDDGLAYLHRYFDLTRLLSQPRGIDAIVRYFTQSAPLYFFAHSARGAMHMAVSADGKFRRRGYVAQSRMVERQVRATGARRVLEIGCGRGFNLLQLGRRNPGVAFTGVDLTPWHVRAGRLLAWRQPNVEIHEGDFHELRLPDGHFDLVFSVEAVCHAEDVYRVMREVRRLLRPAGRFVSIEPWRCAGFAKLPEPVRTSVRVVEQAFILPNLQEFDRWVAKTSALGFALVTSEDLTAAILPNLEKLRRQAFRWRRLTWGHRLMHRIAPHAMENALAAILMGECFRDGISPTAPGCYRLAVLDRETDA
jgi:SAM-dependent methyltransferase